MCRAASAVVSHVNDIEGNVTSQPVRSKLVAVHVLFGRHPSVSCRQRRLAWSLEHAVKMQVLPFTLPHPSQHTNNSQTYICKSSKMEEEYERVKLIFFFHQFLYSLIFFFHL